MANNFQKIVLMVAIVMFIILMIFIGSVLYQNKYSKAFPPVISECPDYWIDKQMSISNPDEDSNSGKTRQSCVNVKNLGNSSCSKTMDFTEDFWQGSTGDCRKYKWAKGCDLTWDGITNSPDICDSTTD
jgi:hypothetical protein